MVDATYKIMMTYRTPEVILHLVRYKGKFCCVTEYETPSGDSVYRVSSFNTPECISKKSIYIAVSDPQARLWSYRSAKREYDDIVSMFPQKNSH